MNLAQLQPDAMAILDAAYLRACAVVDPDLIRLAQTRIDVVLRGARSDDRELTEREADIAAVVDQMLIDVSGLDDATAARAARHFDDGGFADFAMAEYILEARARLTIASDRLLGAQR
ncbi:MAG: hypothetical protein PSX37_04855 [bacterium]|nr:hypothetical protein [bacterium]